MTDTPKPPGRPRIYGERLVSFNLYVTPSQRDWLRQQVNASAAIRQMIDERKGEMTTATVYQLDEMRVTEFMHNGLGYRFVFDPDTDDPKEGATLTYLADAQGNRLAPSEYAEKEAWEIAKKNLGL